MALSCQDLEAALAQGPAQPFPTFRVSPKPWKRHGQFSLKTTTTSLDTELYNQTRNPQIQIPALWTPGAPNHPCTCTGPFMDTLVTILFFPSKNPGQVKSSSGKEAVNIQLCPGSLWVATDPTKPSACLASRCQTSTATLDLVLELKTRALK